MKLLKIKDMKVILLLGGYGFIGTNILKYIDANHADKYRVVVFDRFPKHLDNIKFDCVAKTYAGDFSDEYLLERVFSENDIDLVIHSLSASVPASSQDNEFDIRFNVLPTIKFLNLMVKHDVKSIVFLSSGGAIYGDHYVDKDGHVEEEALFPKSAYGISKLIIEKYLYLYTIQHGVKSLILRLSNPYGPYHYSQKQGIINIAMERALDGKPFEIWGDGMGKKDYIYIEDFCSILLTLIEKWKKSYEVLNVGSGQNISVNDIVSCLKEEVSPSFSWMHENANLLDVQDFKLNLTALKTIVGDYNFLSLKEGIKRTSDWYLSKKERAI